MLDQRIDRNRDRLIVTGSDFSFRLAPKKINLEFFFRPGLNYEKSISDDSAILFFSSYITSSILFMC